MKYIGWIISLILVVSFYILYKAQYAPMADEITKLEKEIAMWENVLKGEKGLTGDRYRFATDRFFKEDRLTPYGEVEILRKFELGYAGVDLYISAPNALARATDVISFLSSQRIGYKSISCIVVIDSVERFEYKFSK